MARSSLPVSRAPSPGSVLLGKLVKLVFLIVFASIGVYLMDPEDVDHRVTSYSYSSP